MFAARTSMAVRLIHTSGVRVLRHAGNERGEPRLTSAETEVGWRDFPEIAAFSCIRSGHTLLLSSY